MGVPDIVDLDTSSDTRFRDIYARHHNRMITRSGNLIRTVYHHVSGAQANVSAAEIVSLDATENAQYDLILRNSTAPLSTANLTNANISTWSASSLLSLRQDTTSIRSTSLAVNSLSATSLNVAPGTLNKMDNFVVQSFQKTLVTGAGAATEICNITQTHGIYTAELDIIQSNSINTNISRSYKFISWYNATNNTWRRLVPLASTGNNAQQWGVEIRVNNDVTTLRLVRLSGSATSGFECVLKISQPRATPVSIANSTVTENAGNVMFSTTIHDNSVIGQSLGRVGIGTDTPTQLLTVAGAANVQSLTVTGDATFDGNVLRVDSGNNRVGISTTNPNYALDVTGDVNTSGVLRIGGTQVLSGTTLNTALQSNITTLGTLTGLSLGTAGTATLASTVIQTFQKTLPTASGNVSEICVITGTNLTFAGHLYVVQAETGKACLVYPLCVSAQTGSAGTTSGAWQRLVPQCSISLPSVFGVAVEISVDAAVNGTCKLRLVRVATAGTNANIECVLVLQQSRSNPITITDSTTTASGQTLATVFFKGGTTLAQVNGNVGIGTDTPTDLLTVTGSANVRSLVVAGDATFNVNTLCVDAGNTRVNVGGTLEATGTNHLIDATQLITLTRTISTSVLGNGQTIGTLRYTAPVTVDLRLNQSVDANNRMTKTYTFPLLPDYVTADGDSLPYVRVLPISTSWDTTTNDIGLDLSTTGTGNAFLSLVQTSANPGVSGANVQVSMTLHYNKQATTIFTPTNTFYLSNVSSGIASSIYKATPMTQTFAGTVGILRGTPAPGYAMDVNGDVNIGGNIRSSLNVRGLRGGFGSGVVINDDSSSLTVVGTANVQSLIVTGNSTLGNLLRVDAGNNRVGILTATPSSTLDVSGDFNTTGVLRVSGTQVLSGTALGSGITSSSLTTLGTLGNLSMNTTGTASLGNFIVRSFQKSLGSAAGSATEICTVSGTTGDAYTAELNVVQTSTANVTYPRTYKYSAFYSATGGNWLKLLPEVSANATAQLWNVEIRVNVRTTTLRLVRVSGTETGNIECTLTVCQSRAHPMTIADSTVTASSITPATTIYKGGTQLCHVEGNIGIGTDTPSSMLTVGGRATTLALHVDGSNSYVYHNAPLLQGGHISWNSDAATGPFDLINKYGTGGFGGFRFYSHGGSGSATPLDSTTLLATLNNNGLALNKGYFNAPGAIIGSMFATGKDSTINEGVTISPTTLTKATYNTNWTTVATFTYTPKSTDSRISVHFDDDYVINGNGADTFKSRITVDGTEVAFKQQVFNGTTAGSGTRSNVILPISAVFKNTSTAQKTIRIQMYMNDTDDTLTLASLNWMFELLERQT